MARKKTRKRTTKAKETQSRIPIELWREAYDLADRVKEIEPWYGFFDSDPFAFTNPQTGEPAFITLMGSGGEHLAIAVYPDTAAIQKLMELTLDDSPDPMDLLFIRQLQVSFEDREFVEDQDRAVIRELGKKYRGSMAWPVFRSHVPAHLPWFVDEDELHLLVHALRLVVEQVPKLNEEYREGFLGQMFAFDEQALFLDADPPELRVVDLPPTGTPSSIPAPDPKLVDAVQDWARVEESLELAQTLGPPVHEPGKRPQLPLLTMVAIAAEDILLGFDLQPPEPDFDAACERTAESLVKILEPHQIIPAAVKVNDPAVEVRLRGLAKAAGFKVTCTKHLPSVDSALDSFLHFMETGELPSRPKSRRPKSNTPSRSSKKTPFATVFQFEITLLDIQPPVWRRIEVPETYSFWDLHVAIQDAMGWTDSHLHCFDIADGLRERHIGIVTDDFPDDEAEPGWEVPIRDVFHQPGIRVHYTYDFGDNWEHLVELEAVKPKASRTEYPICTGGERACPPEDCGGAWGHAELLDILADPSHPDYEDTLEWIGGEFDPEAFDPEAVWFMDPQDRLELILP